MTQSGTPAEIANHERRGVDIRWRPRHQTGALSALEIVELIDALRDVKKRMEGGGVPDVGSHLHLLLAVLEDHARHLALEDLRKNHHHTSEGS